jgi:hypothetical protein
MGAISPSSALSTALHRYIISRAVKNGATHADIISPHMQAASLIDQDCPTSSATLAFATRFMQEVAQNHDDF